MTDHCSNLMSSVPVSRLDKALVNHSPTSSCILSMCPLSMDSENDSSSNEDEIIRAIHHKGFNVDALINTSRCKSCRTFLPSKRMHICRRCQLAAVSNASQLDHVSDSRRSSESGSVGTEQSFNTSEETRSEFDSSPAPKPKRASSHRGISRLLNTKERKCSSLPVSIAESSPSSSQSCLLQLLLRPQLQKETRVHEQVECPPPAPVLCPVNHSIEDQTHWRARQVQLDEVVQQLIKTFQRKATEYRNEICQVWTHLKRVSLYECPLSHNTSRLLQGSFSATRSKRFLDLSFEQNDELDAAFQVLATSILIAKDTYSLCEFAQFFDDEERRMLEQLADQLDFSLSSYTDEHRMITERIHFYQNQPSDSKTVDWIQIIKDDYPPLIERISNDFINQTPSCEQTLVKMLTNIKRRLCNAHSD